jgi:hypothetical protein
MTQIIVSPRIWDPDYAVVVAISGVDLEISRTVRTPGRLKLARTAPPDEVMHGSLGPIARACTRPCRPTPPATPQVNAHFAGKDQRGLNAYLMEFDLIPTTGAASSFTFNVQGRQPELVTLQCRCGRSSCVLNSSLSTQVMARARSDPRPSPELQAGDAIATAAIAATATAAPA